MTKKYIDAEKLERHFENCIDEVRNTNGVTEDFEIALTATKNQPAIDVQEVRHGEWEQKNDIFTCSECGYQFECEGYTQFFNFCPNCGCKMDGETNDP